MNEDLLTTNGIINLDKQSELIVDFDESKEYKFFISSEYRDTLKFPNPSEFVIQLENDLSRINNLKLLEIEINKYKTLFNKPYIFEWEYPENEKLIPIEDINSIEKIDDKFKLNRVLYGYTKSFDTNNTAILFTFTSPEIIIISLFGDGAKYHDLYKVIIPSTLPISITFTSLDSDISYSYTLKDIELYDIPDGQSIKKAYKLTVIPDNLTTCKPFNNCFNNNGHILMYIHNKINHEMDSYIPSNYKKQNRLIIYDKLLKNPVIHNNLIFGTNIDYKIEYFLLEKYKNIKPIEIDSIPCIDKPKYNKFSVFIESGDTLEICSEKLQNKKIIYKDRQYYWRIKAKPYIILEHYQILNTNPTKKNDKIYLNVENNSVNRKNIIFTNNNYYSIFIDMSGKPYFHTKDDCSGPFYVLSNCSINKKSSKFFHLLKLNYKYNNSNWNNFIIRNKNPIQFVYVYGTDNNLILELLTCNGLSVGDRIVLRDIDMTDNRVLNDNIPKYISKISNKNSKYLITISLGTFYISKNHKKEYIKCGNGGYISKILPPNETVYNKNICLKIDNFNYIKTLNNKNIQDTFAIINKNNCINGGNFISKQFVKNITNFNIKLLQDNNQPCTHIESVNMLISLSTK